MHIGFASGSGLYKYNVLDHGILYFCRLMQFYPLHSIWDSVYVFVLYNYYEII